MKKTILAVALQGLLFTAILNTGCHRPAGSGNETTTGEKGAGEEEGEGSGGFRQTGADKQMMTWLWSKGYPDPTHLSKKFWKGWLQYIEIKQNTQNLLNPGGVHRTESYGNWSEVGTSVANIGGRILCIAIDPDNTTRLFIGSASGGIWKSTNSGSSWTSVPVVESGTGLTLPVLGVSSIIIRPGSAGQEILAGTGEVYRVDTSNIGFNVWKARGTYGIGIIRSTDGGATWTRVYNKDMSEMFGIQMLKYDPNNSSIVWACGTDGLYKSTDAGVNWTLIRAKTYVSDIAINPSNSNQIAIAFGNMKNPSKGVEYSTNGGTNWSAASGIPAFNGYIRLDCSSDGSNLFASVGQGGSANELYLSTNFGQTWFAKTGSSHCGGQYWFGHDLAVNPSNANEVMMGGVNYYSYVSSNATTGGSRTSRTGGHADVHDIKYDPSNPSIIYIANDGGMYKKTAGVGGTTSAINSGLNAVQFYASFAVSPTDPNSMIGGLQDNGVVKWNGTSWSSILGGDGGPSMYHPKNGQRVLYSQDARSVWSSTNNGGSETQRLINLGYGYATPYDDRTAFMSPIAMSYPDAGNPNIVYYAASDNLHISLDSGTSFSRGDPSLMTRPIDATYKPAIALSVSRSNPNKVYVSTSPLSQKADDGLYVNMPARVMRSLNASNNASYTFSDISTSLPDRFTTDFAISRFSDDSVYITMGGFGTGHVWLTPDGGTTWLNRSSGLPDVPFNAILIDPIRPNVIYAACDFGVYVSHNKGATWFDFNEGFPGTVLVMDLQATADNKIVAATHGRGVFKADLFSPPITLPVTIRNFSGVNKGSYNQLKWTVEQETDLSRYVVERSTDGSNFTPVGTRIATNSSGVLSYQMDDPLNGMSGKFYYRLKAYNRDESYLYSEIILIKTEKKSQVTIVGNPVRDRLVLRYSTTQSGVMDILILDATGRVIRRSREEVAEGSGTHTVNGLEQLRPGLHIVSILINGERFSEKIIKL